MEIYLIFVGILLLLAAADLTVGVANDAVNFVNSAVGSKAAPMKIILFIAALGVFTGVLLSGGMMEVARKGIFDPGQFIMPELLIIFVAVMFTDVLLLDFFNTFGMPTSTTVSLILGLFGSSLAISIIKIFDAGQSFNAVVEFINFANLLKIVTAILISIGFAFVFGFLTQYLTRLLFTFDYHKTFRRYGSIWSGLAFTLLSYFMLVKGLKGAHFMSDDIVNQMSDNLGLVLLILFGSWTIIIQFLMWFTKVNVLKIIVLMGTFSLALAFAANDLVNFIGAPLAGLNAYQASLSMDNPLSTNMSVLNEPVPVNIILLLLAAVIMIVTLYLSKKARSVIKTEVSLGRQDEGIERFESNAIGRMIVRVFLIVSNVIKKITPKALRKFNARRFDLSQYKSNEFQGEAPSFDLLRASVNLMVSAALISIGTSFKLPLSTTYVTFIVAMSTALPDKAWGRDSAVYRVSGVVTVIGGWFFTGLIAASLAFTIAVFLHFTFVYGLVALLGLSVYSFYRTTRVNKKREEEFDELAKMANSTKLTPKGLMDITFSELHALVDTIQRAVNLAIEGTIGSDLKALKKSKKIAKKLNKDINKFTNEILKMSRFAETKKLDDEGFIFIKEMVSIYQLAERTKNLTNSNFDYFDNNHHPFLEIHRIEYKELKDKINNQLALVSSILLKNEFNQISHLEKITKETESLIDQFNKNQLKRIKGNMANMRRSKLFLDNLSDVRVLSSSLMSICKACKTINDTLLKNPANMSISLEDLSKEITIKK